MKKYIIIIIVLAIIIIPVIVYKIIPKKITYYKCSERPNNPLLTGIFENHKISLQKEGFDIQIAYLSTMPFHITQTLSTV